MTHKNKEQELKEPKTEQKRELNEVNDLTLEFKDKAFPTRMRGLNQILEFKLDGIKTCWICMDLPAPGTTVLHLYLPPDKRNTYIINIMVEMFYSHVHPWCKSKDCVQILVNCPGEDLKTAAMFTTFGFKVQNINLAMMPII